MSIDKIKQKLFNDSIQDSGWLEKAKWRQENEDWLDISFNIAVKILSTLRINKRENKYPKTNLELAELMEFTPVDLNKILRGQENLDIKTICKLQRILNITLI